MNSNIYDILMYKIKRDGTKRIIIMGTVGIDPNYVRTNEICDRNLYINRHGNNLNDHNIGRCTNGLGRGCGYGHGFGSGHGIIMKYSFDGSHTCGGSGAASGSGSGNGAGSLSNAYNLPVTPAEIAVERLHS